MVPWPKRIHARGSRWVPLERVRTVSLAAVEGDASAAREIQQYWDRHIPFMMAVHSDYDYLALQTSGDPAFCAVVHGSAPNSRTPASSHHRLMRFLRLWEKLPYRPSRRSPALSFFDILTGLPRGTRLQLT